MRKSGQNDGMFEGFLEGFSDADNSLVPAGPSNGIPWRRKLLDKPGTRLLSASENPSKNPSNMPSFLTTFSHVG